MKRPRTPGTTPTKQLPKRPPGRLGLRAAPSRPIMRTGRGINRTELKACDANVMASIPKTDIIGATAVFTGLNLIQAGTGFYNRIGKKINMRSLHLTGQVIVIAPGAIVMDGLPEYGRILVVYDKQPNGAFPAPADVLANHDNQGALSSNPFCNINQNNSDRFRIIRDIRLDIPNDDPDEATSGDNAMLGVIDYTTNRVNVNEFIFLNGLETQYSATANPATIAEISTGALFLMTWGVVPSNNSSHAFKWTARLRYNDS